jgi:hypothetical protein
MPSCLPILRMLARRRALPLPEFSGAPADRIVDPVERDQPGVRQVQVAVEAIPLLSFLRWDAFHHVRLRGEGLIPVPLPPPYHIDFNDIF